MKKKWKKVLSCILVAGITIQSITGYAEDMEIREKDAVKSREEMFLQGAGSETAKEDITQEYNMQKSEENIISQEREEEIESEAKETDAASHQESIAGSESGQP